jgi:hypothetical protein
VIVAADPDVRRGDARGRDGAEDSERRCIGPVPSLATQPRATNRAVQGRLFAAFEFARMPPFCSCWARSGIHR